MNAFDFVADEWRKHLSELSETLAKLNQTTATGNVILPSLSGATGALDTSSATRDAIQSITGMNTLGMSATNAIQEMLAGHRQRLQETLSGISASHTTVINKLAEQFQAQVDRDWGEMGVAITAAFERTENSLQRVELLATLGWTLPMNMSMPDFNSLMHDHLTESVDTWFVEYFDEPECRSLRDRLLTSKQLEFWKPLFEQIFDSYSSGHYAICIPGLLAILEGCLAVPWHVVFQNEKRRKQLFRQKIEAAADDSFNQALWKSVASFIDNVFQSDVSANREHLVLKRNLILHGKSDPAKWNQADCLRLFQAIDSILSLHEEEP